MNKHYDQQSFINFCLSKKDNGDDINSWTIEELTLIVQEFIKNQQTEESKDKKPKV